MRQFTVHIEGHFVLDEDQIWPDKDGPSAPTVVDVAKEIREHTFGVGRLISDWNLLPRVSVTGAGEGIDVDWRQSDDSSESRP